MSEEKMDQELYRLIYAIDGEPCLVQLVPHGARLEGLFRPTKAYCTFDGWGEIPARMPAEDLVLDGHFTTDIYRVVFASGVEQYGLADLPAGKLLKAPHDPVREGYDFVRWEGYDGTMPAENRTYEAVFVPRTYRVTYVIDDIYRLHVKCPFGVAFPRLAEPVRQNCVFSGWSEMPATMPAHDVVITGRFEEKKYKLTRMVDGEVFSEEYLPFGAEVDRRVKPVQEGYYFSGWRKLPGTMPAHDVEVVASMYPARYRVDFYINGEPTESVYVPFGEAIPTMPIEEKPGTLFGGWLDLPKTMPAHDIAVHGSLTAILYRLSFEVDGEEIDRRDLAEGSRIPKDVKVPTKPGYAFCGWAEAPRQMPGHDLTLRAIYAAVRSRYVFMIDGEVYSDIQPEEGEELVMPVPASEDGKPFSGWGNVEQNPRTGVTTFHGTFSEDMTYSVRYLVKDEEVRRDELPAGAQLNPPEVASCEAYEFLGWQDLPARMPAEDLVVHAELKELKYTLVFEVEGEVIYSMVLDPGQEIACPAVAPREGYTFSGWKRAPRVMPGRDLTVKGSYQLNRHTVTYMLEGETLQALSCAYGETLVPPEVPEEIAAGRVFAGWAPVIDAMPNEDIVIEGAFTDTVCLVDVYVDGILHSTIRAKVGEKLTLPEFPLREGSRFIWQNVPNAVPPGKLDVHGGYVKNLYTITYLSGERVVGEEHYYYGSALTPKVKLSEEERTTFLAWHDLPETMPSRDLRVRAVFADRTCHVTFRLDGRVHAEMDVPVGAAVPNPEVPTRDGYRFDGWRNYVDVMPPYNFTAYGTYSRRTYRITYLCGDNVVEEQDYVSGAPIVAPPAPKRDHYVFRAWEGLGTHMPAEDICVSARYRGETFRISFVIDGVLVESTHKEFGERIIPYEPQPLPGQKFSGWSELPQFMPARELIVTGSFKPCTHTVTYKVGGMIYRIDTYETGAVITPPVPPERRHARFVRWRNLASAMPDYDFVAVAEYEDIIGHYRFVIAGAILAEGDKRKNEPWMAPEPPYRPGYAFSGWQDFTGLMPAGDVTFVGGYRTDTFKINYYLDGEFYHCDGYYAGDRIMPATPPTQEGYVFEGWQRLPDLMPEDDIRVDGHMQPLLYTLRYRTDGRDIVYEKETPCGTPLHRIEAPQRFGYAFSGWSNEPDVMPAQDLTINGVYRYVGETFETLRLTDGAYVSENATVEKSYPKVPGTIIFFSGDYMRIVVDDICYPVQVPTGRVYLRNGHVVDEEGLYTVLRRMWRKYRLPRKATLVLSDGYQTDVFYEATRDEPVPDDIKMRGLYRDAKIYGDAGYHALPLSQSLDGTRYLISRYHAPTYETLRRIFERIHVTLTSCNTLIGALAAYLQPNRNMRRKQNQICLFYLPNTLVGVLMADGQIACVVRNAYPFEGRMWDTVGETDRVLEILVKEAHRQLIATPLTTIAIGGCDRTHARTMEKCVKKQIKLVVERVIGDSIGGLFGGVRHWRKTEVVSLGFGHVINRTK